MNLDKEKLKTYLKHILEAITRIDQYIEDIYEVDFLTNSLVQDAVIRNLEIIGEASNNIQKNFPEFVKKHPDIPFLFAYQMRNVISHGYFKVDMDIVWKTVQRDLPVFYQKVQNAYAQITHGEANSSC